MVELVDTPDLGSGAARRGGSSPFARTLQSLREQRHGNHTGKDQRPQWGPDREDSA